MASDTNVTHLIINRLSNEQYETAVKSDTELWLTPELPASTTNLGPVKVDGTTITASADGTLTAVSQVTVDSALSTTSTNPVQNKVITTNMVKGVTGSGATITVTKGDNTTSTFTIDNVTNASKATYDSNGDEIAATYAKTSALATVATSGSYNDLSNKPTIPTVNNATLTIQKNGTTVETFTANSSANKTANIIVPTKLSEFTDDLGSSPTHTHSQYSTTADTVTGVVAGSTANKINVTKNGSTSTITINNVANATNATKATQDASGNVITTTYSTKAETITDVAAGTTADKISVTKNGSTSTITVNNVASATSATKATNDVDGNPIKTTYLKVADKPVVNNATLTIQKNSTNVATFTANASSNVTANIIVPTKLSEFTDDLGTSPTHTHSQYSTTANTVSAVVAGSTADKINVTKNGSTSTITVNNVATATSATKDSAGNTISTYYAPKATTLAGYGITDAYTKTEIDGMVSAGMHYKGTVASASNLPTTGNKVGDLYNVTDTGANYAWSGTDWDKLSENIDLSGLASKAEAAGSLSGSNATLTLKNVNGGTLSTVTVNNVANATNATKATQDASGNTITSTYSTKSETVTSVTAGSSADKINVTKNGSTSTITVNNVASATKATQDGDGNVISSTYLKSESDTLSTVLNRGNSASTDINFNSKDWFNAGTRLSCYYYSTSQTPNTQYYWYKITPPPVNSKADRYWINIESDVNYPSKTGNFFLDISAYTSKSNTSYSVSLISTGTTGGSYSDRLLNVAIDANGYVYVQTSAVWSSYMRFIRYGTETTNNQYEQVGLAAFGTADGFTPLKMITDTGCIRIYNGELSGTYYTLLDADYFREKGKPLSQVYVPLDGGTMTGALNLANNTWNLVGDDAYLGDCNVAGTVGIKGKNAATGINFVPYSGSTSQKLTINGSGTMTITGTVASTFSGNLTGNVTGTADKSKQLVEEDTRSENKTPSQYFSTYPKSIKSDFKSGSTIGLTSSYYQVQTYTPWTDNSGGYPSQIAFDNHNNKIHYRRGTDGSTWSEWKQLAFTDDIKNATLTIQADGTSKGTFTANASSNATINIQKSDFYPTKTYTGLIGTSNEWKNATFYLLTVRPVNWNKEWTVQYRLEAGLDDGITPSNYQYFTSQHECYLSGRQGVYTAYSNFNSISSTDYRTIYYHINQRTTEAGYNAGNGHKIGIDLTSAKEPINTSYKRTIKITILNSENCTVTFNDTPEIPSNSTRTDYTKLNSTYYTTTEANSAGNWSRLNGYTNGLQETGDANDNTYNQLMMSNSYLVNGSKNNSTGLYIFNYNIIGFDKDGKALCISVPSASATAASTAVNTARVYNTVGFDYNKGLMYTGQNTAYASGANMNISPRVAHSQLDLRYSDNAVAASSANTLGMVMRKPVYFRGTIGDDGLFYLAPLEVTYNSATYKRVWTQDLPTTEDGYVYWFVGYPYYNSSYPNSAYQINFYPDKQVFHFKDGKYQIYVPAGSVSNSGSFTTSNWTLSNSKYNYTITLAHAQANANVLFYDSNNQQVFPEEVKLTKSNGKITAITAVIGSDPDCRFAGTYSIFY